MYMISFVILAGVFSLVNSIQIIMGWVPDWNLSGIFFAAAVGAAMVSYLGEGFGGGTN